MDGPGLEGLEELEEGSTQHAKQEELPSLCSQFWSALFE